VETFCRLGVDWGLACLRVVCFGKVGSLFIKVFKMEMFWGCWAVFLGVVLSAGSADHDGLDLAYAFDFFELGFELVDYACFVFWEGDLD
jgi:hypothetical protein